jgi:hypothetical protein
MVVAARARRTRRDRTEATIERRGEQECGQDKSRFAEIGNGQPMT